MLRRASGYEQKENEVKLADPEYYDELAKKVPWYHKVLLNKPLKVILVMFLLAMVAPTLIFYFCVQEYHVKTSILDGYEFGTCSHDVEHRVPCGPIDITAKECIKHCCLDEDRGGCYHRMTSRYSFIVNVSAPINYTMNRRQESTPFRGFNNVIQLLFTIGDVSESHTRFAIFDPRRVEYDFGEVVIPDKRYNYTIYTREFYLEFHSTELNLSKPLMSTARGPLVASQRIWEWSFYLGEETMYGLSQFILKPNSSKIFYNNPEDPSTLPFVMTSRNGSYHGVYLEHHGTMVFNLTGNGVIDVKSYSGEGFIGHFFHGSRPKDIIKEFLTYVGRQRIPPYWALGVHFCRFNTTDDDYQTLLDLSIENDMPYDSDCVRDDLFPFINTKLPNMEEYLTTLTNNSKKFLPKIRPHYDFSISNAIGGNIMMVMDPNVTRSFRGVSFGKEVGYPDYSSEPTIKWLSGFWQFDDRVDSFIVKDSWPRNDRTNQGCSTNLPYITDEINTTLCQSIPWNARQPNSSSLHHNYHNRYGSDFSKAVLANILNQNDSFVMASSIFSGDEVGLHIQSVDRTWKSMKDEFLRLVANSMHGVFVQSIPVCGDATHGEDEDLCIRWYWNSVALPIFHVQSNHLRMDPFAFSGFATKTMIKAIKRRYMLLPYYYTVLNKHEPLLRGMYYDFYDYEDTKDIDSQFMVGDSILFAPDFSQDDFSIPIYFPPNETWYDLWGGVEVGGGEMGWEEVMTTKTDVHMYLRGGHIIPVQEDIYSNAVETRLNSSYTLLIGLKCYENTTVCQAGGSLFLGNDTFLQFEANMNYFTVYNVIEAQGYVCDDQKTSSSVIDSIRVYGYELGIGSGLGIDVCKLTGDVEVFPYDDIFYI